MTVVAPGLEIIEFNPDQQTFEEFLMEDRGVPREIVDADDPVASATLDSPAKAAPKPSELKAKPSTPENPFAQIIKGAMVLSTGTKNVRSAGRTVKAATAQITYGGQTFHVIRFPGDTHHTSKGGLKFSLN